MKLGFGMFGSLIQGKIYNPRNAVVPHVSFFPTTKNGRVFVPNKKSGTPGSLGGRVESFEPSGSRSKRFRALEAQRFRKTNGKNDPDPPITGWWFETLFLIFTPTFLGR